MKVLLLLAINIFFFSCFSENESAPIIDTPINKETTTEQKKKQAGIALSFDDYYPIWFKSLDILNKYNAKTTFFVLGQGYSPLYIKNLKKLLSAGHEIGWHTQNHPNMDKLFNRNYKQFKYELIGSLNYVEKDLDYKITSFAYPYGQFNEATVKEINKYFSQQRAFRYAQVHYSLNEAQKQKLLYSTSIDNIHFKTFKEFTKFIDSALIKVKQENLIFFATSHNFSSGQWSITHQRLEYLLQQINKLDLKFYTYKDFLQKKPAADIIQLPETPK